MNFNVATLLLTATLICHGTNSSAASDATTANAQSKWVLSTDDFDSDYTGVAVANGTLGVLPWREPFSVRHIVMNHVMELNDATRVNCNVLGINPFGVAMLVDGKAIDSRNCSSWQQSLNMHDASHKSSFVADGKIEVSYTIVALRNIDHSAVMRIELKALNDADVVLRNTMTVPSEDYRSHTTVSRILNVEGSRFGVLQSVAQTMHNRYTVAATSAFIGEQGTFVCSLDGDSSLTQISLSKGQTARLTLVASICSTRECSDPLSETERELFYIGHKGVDSIMEGHNKLWDEMWQGDIIIEGDDEAQRAVRLALFNLYAGCRRGSALSIPPMGLSSTGYNGHIFWDAEIWMLPPMLLLNSDIARSMVDYRVDRLAAARAKASSYGYRGAMFPWESDEFGEESTPSWALCSQYEQHISADVAIGCWNYYRVSGDREWLQTEGWPLLRDVATFWADRAERNDDGSWSIKGVQGADEYAVNVDDNAYTNGAVMAALRYAVDAGRVVNRPTPKVWREIADGLRITQNREGVTLEHSRYDGEQIKQADVNLLGYPLNVISDRQQILRDLEYYDSKIDQVNGPAMTYSIFAVEYARLGMADRAEEMFRKAYRPNMRPPFGVFAETPASNNPYFVTGAGGLLQAVLFGFGGLEITDKGVEQLSPILPSSWRSLTIKGVGAEKKTYTVVNPKPAR
ncbi:MAG: glycoside hydrolase family 65 protein [Tidjanibacter sp.]|nr:glycoside hydrolase family 65 protein [Tidjanibacter sp.]